MTVRADIAGVVNNDLTYTFSLTYNSAPLDLTGITVTAVIKSGPTVLDNTGASYTIGSGLTMLAIKAGRFQLSIPRAVNTTPGNQWYRVDVTVGGNVYSCMCGVLNVMAA